MRMTRPPLPKDRFEVREHLGSGALGSLFEVLDRRFDRRLAVRTLPPLDDGGTSQLERLDRYLLGGIHPNLASLVEIRRVMPASGEKPVVCLMWELLEGKTLAAHLGQDGPMTVEQAVTVACLALEGLEELHQRGIVHGNVKPSNIFLIDDGLVFQDHVKLLDPGLTLPGLGQLREDPGVAPLGVQDIAFLSPEQLAGEEPDTRSDMFSLATVLYTALTGEHPFCTEEMGLELAAEAIQLHVPRFIASAPPQVPLDLLGVLAAALCKDPDGRFDETWELRRDLEPYSLDLPPRPAPARKKVEDEPEPASPPPASPPQHLPLSPSPVGLRGEGADHDPQNIVPAAQMDDPMDTEPTRLARNPLEREGAARRTALLPGRATGPLEDQPTTPGVPALAAAMPDVFDPGSTMLVSEDEIEGREVPADEDTNPGQSPDVDDNRQTIPYQERESGAEEEPRAPVAAIEPERTQAGARDDEPLRSNRHVTLFGGVVSTDGQETAREEDEER